MRSLGFPLICQFIDKYRNSTLKIAFVNKNINITACPHPRFGIILPYHRPFERYKRDFRFIHRFTETPKFVVYLLISVNCEHHLILKFRFDFTIAYDVVFCQRVADKMGKVMGF